ncbi:MAG: DNA-formamidopyrimidine glycosylase family protein [Verrucomicrobiota bacterium]
MPELGEVEWYRKRWDPALGHRVQAVFLHPRCRIFRGLDTEALVNALDGATPVASAARAKQMLFEFRKTRGTCWLGIHLGMSGKLRVVKGKAFENYRSAKHDHLVLLQENQCAVFTDTRHFGRVLFHQGKTPPEWWTSLPPDIVGDAFTTEVVAAFCRRRTRSPLKAVLLMQERFPGIGNWMADEILWRAGLHPARHAGSLSEAEMRTLWKETRWVAREALKRIGTKWKRLPDSWLFNHRWAKGRTCPKTGAALVREKIGGRTTCWSPGCQPPPGTFKKGPHELVQGGRPGHAAKKFTYP